MCCEKRCLTRCHRLITRLVCLMCCDLAAQLDTNTYLNNHRGTVGVTRHRNTCYFVGAMLCSIFNFLLILVLGALLFGITVQVSVQELDTGVVVCPSSYTHFSNHLFVLTYTYVLRACVLQLCKCPGVAPVGCGKLHLAVAGLENVCHCWQRQEFFVRCRNCKVLCNLSAVLQTIAKQFVRHIFTIC